MIEIYQTLLDAYGPQSWWPAETRLEMMVGSILVQNTAWTNVEGAMKNLKPYLEYETLNQMDVADLEVMIQPAGFYKAKARTIKALMAYLKHYDFDLDAIPKEHARKELLAIKGIGPETADCILLYALDVKVFVVDTYLKRMLLQLRKAQFKTYNAYQEYMMNALPDDLYIYQEFHALIVEYGKRKDDMLKHLIDPVLPYTDAMLEVLTRESKEFSLLVDEFGRVERPVFASLFDAIVYTIIGQLVSVKAAQSIQARFDAQYPWSLDVVKDSVETLQSVGLTKNKAKAIHAIATGIVSGDLDLYALTKLPDEMLVKELVKLPGLGDWSARMILLHGFHRLDVSSYDDVALRRGVMFTYGLEDVDRETYDQILSQFKPYRSIASIYFWRKSVLD